jgi:antitoxin (DNA-binding transcriptional repressor) of toxin-antitoxin stability system
MKTLPVGEFKTHFSEVIDDVRAGRRLSSLMGKRKKM